MTRSVAITGIAGGIGRACAATFVAEGWRVFGIDRQGGEIPGVEAVMVADVAQEADCDRFFSTIGVGRLDALVNNAAVPSTRGLLATTLDEWNTVLATNLTAAFLALRAARRLLGDGSAIVNVSSVHAHATSGAVGAYAVSKGGLSAFTRAAAIELAPSGIRVNAVVPGAVETPMLRPHGVSSPTAIQELAARTPLGRVAAPAEIASAVLFLADSARSSFITGQELVVDGGALVQLSTEPTSASPDPHLQASE